MPIHFYKASLCWSEKQKSFRQFNIDLRKKIGPWSYVLKKQNTKVSGLKKRYVMPNEKNSSEQIVSTEGSSQEDDENMIYRAQRGELSVDFLICCFFWCSCVWWAWSGQKDSWLQCTDDNYWISCSRQLTSTTQNVTRVVIYPHTSDVTHRFCTFLS